MKKLIKKLVRVIWWEPITTKVTATVCDISSEIYYYDRRGKCIGFSAYGTFDPSAPYTGD